MLGPASDAASGCGDTQPCCDGLACPDGFWGGCRGRATAYSSDSQCCLNNRTGLGCCLSLQGGACEEDLDCRSCYEDFTNCPGACGDGGTCTV